jgi:hypothetical protein
MEGYRYIMDYKRASESSFKPGVDADISASRSES